MATRLQRSMSSSIAIPALGKQSDGVSKRETSIVGPSFTNCSLMTGWQDSKQSLNTASNAH